MRFEFFGHPAGVKFRAFGGSLEEVFKNAGLAAADSMSKDNIQNVLNYEVKVNGSDKEELLHNFLDEIVSLFKKENFLISEISNLRIKESDRGFELSAALFGDYSGNYEINKQISSVSYNGMIVFEEGGQWTAQVVLDD